MATHGKNTGVAVDEYDLSTYFRDISGNSNVDAADVSTFGATYKSYITGLGDGTLGASGLWHGDAGEVDAVLFPIIGSGNQNLVTASEAGWGTVGNYAFIMAAEMGTYTIGASISDAVNIGVDWISSSDPANDLLWGARGGRVLSTNATITAGGASVQTDGASVDWGADYAPSTNGGMAIVHVTSNSEDDASVIKIQDSANDSTWADYMTVMTTTAATTGSAVVADLGDCDRYVRVQTTSGGSHTTGTINHICTFARF